MVLFFYWYACTRQRSYELSPTTVTRKRPTLLISLSFDLHAWKVRLWVELLESWVNEGMGRSNKKTINCFTRLRIYTKGDRFISLLVYPQHAILRLSPSTYTYSFPSLICVLTVSTYLIAVSNSSTLSALSACKSFVAILFFRSSFHDISF